MPEKPVGPQFGPRSMSCGLLWGMLGFAGRCLEQLQVGSLWQGYMKPIRGWLKLNDPGVGPSCTLRS